MAVYRRGYTRYNGPQTTHAGRLLVMPRFAWERILSQKLVTSLLMLSLFWPLACAAFIYLANHTEFWQGFDSGFKRFLNINGNFFRIFMVGQSFSGLLLAAIAGPGLIAPDLTNNALPLYFSRPLSRRDYIASRMIVLIGILSLVTLFPSILLLAMQVGMAGPGWLWDNWYLATGLLIGWSIYIVIVSLVALACSAYVKWRVVAGALVLAFFFVLSGGSEMVNGILRVQWASVFNPGYAFGEVWSQLLGMESLDENRPGALPCGIYLAVLGCSLYALLSRKLRPVEVIK